MAIQYYIYINSEVTNDNCILTFEMINNLVPEFVTTNDVINNKNKTKFHAKLQIKFFTAVGTDDLDV